MTSFKVNDYSLFSSAANTFNQTNNLLTNEMKEMNTLINKLKNEEIFAGPIAENISTEISNASKNIANNVFKLNMYASAFLQTTNTKYASIDNQNSQQIGSV